MLMVGMDIKNDYYLGWGWAKIATHCSDKSIFIIFLHLTFYFWRRSLDFYHDFK